MFHIPDNTRTRTLISYLLLLFVVSPFIAFQLTYCIFAILYVLKTICILTDANPVPVNRNHVLLFLSSIAVLAILAIVHHSVANSPEFMRTVELTLIFAAIAMALDACSFLVRNFKIDIRDIAEKGIWIVAIILLGKFAHAAIQIDSDQWHRLYSINIRRNPITDYNPNHSDDHFVYALFVLLWLAILTPTRKLSTNIVGLISLIVITFLIVQSGSIGGLLGIAFGIIVITLLLILELQRLDNKIAVLGLVAALVMSAIFVIGQTETAGRFHNISTRISTLGADIFSGNQVAYCDPDNPDGLPIVKREYRQVSSMVRRALFYQTGIDLWLDRPILGHGVFDRDSEIVTSHSIGACLFENFAHLHNLYLDILVHGGLTLFLFYLVILIFVISSVMGLYRTDSREIRVISILFLFYIAYLLVENIFDLSFISSAVLKSNLLGLSGIWILSQTQLIQGKDVETQIS